MDIHLTKQDIVDLVRLTSPYIHVVEQAGVYYIGCEKPNVDYSCQEVYEVILTWVIQINTQSIDFRYNPLWFGYVPEETVRKLYEDLIKRNRLIGEVKQKLISEGKLPNSEQPWRLVDHGLPEWYIKQERERFKDEPSAEKFEIPMEGDNNGKQQ